jgi:dienelactone hydrolase
MHKIPAESFFQTITRVALLAGLLLALCIAIPAIEVSEISVGGIAAAVSPIVHSKDRIPCGRDQVAVDIFEPAADGRYPGVILLHGSHGPGRAECYYMQQAEDLARHGYISLFVRYYDRGRKGRGNRRAWSDTIAGALTFATNMRKVDDSRLALVGYSQGAFLALNAAPLDERVRAVVAFYGGLSPGFKESAGQTMPPTLLFHGTKDRIVPVRRALETLSWLKSTGRPADLVIYKGATHGFNLSSRGGADERATEDAWRRTLSFLDFHLRYPAWTPAVAFPTPVVPDGSDAGVPRFFEQDPLEAEPYLEAPAEGEDGFTLINPDPESVPQEVLRASKGKKANKGASAHRKHPRSHKSNGISGKSTKTSGIAGKTSKVPGKAKGSSSKTTPKSRGKRKH